MNKMSEETFLTILQVTLFLFVLFLFLIDYCIGTPTI